MGALGRAGALGTEPGGTPSRPRSPETPSRRERLYGTYDVGP